MRSEHLGESKAHAGTGSIVTAILMFYSTFLVLVALMFLLAAGIAFNLGGLLADGVFRPSQLWYLALLVWGTWQILSLRTRPTKTQYLVDLDEYPALASAVADAALRVSTRAPKAIRLTAAARVSAVDEGGVFGALFGGRKLLVVGAAALPYLSQTEFRILTARALVRWSRLEPWYGALARRVDLAWETIENSLGASWLRWIHPIYWFFAGFQRRFGDTLRTYRQTRELWADRMVAQAYTAAETEEAIKKQALYDSFWRDQLQERLSGGEQRNLEDVWNLVMDVAGEYDSWDFLWGRDLSERPSAASSEPPLRTRLEGLAASLDMPPLGPPYQHPATQVLLQN